MILASIITFIVLGIVITVIPFIIWDELHNIMEEMLAISFGCYGAFNIVMGLELLVRIYS